MIVAHACKVAFLLYGLDEILWYFNITCNSLQILTQVVMGTNAIFVNETSSLLSCLQQFHIFRVVPGHLVKDHITVDGSKTKILQGLFLFMFVRHHFLHIPVIGSQSIVRDWYFLKLSVTLTDGGECIWVFVLIWLSKLKIVVSWVFTLSVEFLYSNTTVCGVATFYVFDHLRLLSLKNVNLLD